MRLTPVHLLVAATLALPATLHAQFATTIDTSRTLITVTGQGRASVAPDRATLTLLLEPQALSVEEAGARIASVERAVIDTLRRFNLPASAIQTFNSGVAPYRTNGMPTSTQTYTGRSVIRVELSRLDQLAAISGAALAKGATFVGQPVLSFSGADSVRRALLPQALQQARREAETLAAAAGGHLGRLVEVTSISNPMGIVEQAQNMSFNGMYYDSGQRTIPVTTVAVSVTTRWLLAH